MVLMPCLLAMSSPKVLYALERHCTETHQAGKILSLCLTRFPVTFQSIEFKFTRSWKMVYERYIANTKPTQRKNFEWDLCCKMHFSRLNFQVIKNCHKYPLFLRWIKRHFLKMIFYVFKVGGADDIDFLEKLCGFFCVVDDGAMCGHSYYWEPPASYLTLK